MRILIIDNYDSFTYNLAHYIEPYVKEVAVIRYNKLSLNDIDQFDRIVISPGPGLPDKYPKLKNIITHFSEKKPLLGICLGLQAIAETYGCSLKNKEKVDHGLAKKTLLTSEKDIIETQTPRNRHIELDLKDLSHQYPFSIVRGETLFRKQLHIPAPQALT